MTWLLVLHNSMLHGVDQNLDDLCDTLAVPFFDFTPLDDELCSLNANLAQCRLEKSLLEEDLQFEVT